MVKHTVLRVYTIYTHAHQTQAYDSMQGIFEGGTSLGDVYEGLVNSALKEAVAEFLADQTSDPTAWRLPSIQHAVGFEAYQVYPSILLTPPTTQDLPL